MSSPARETLSDAALLHLCAPRGTRARDAAITRQAAAHSCGCHEESFQAAPTITSHADAMAPPVDLLDRFRRWVHERPDRVVHTWLEPSGAERDAYRGSERTSRASIH